MTGPLARERRHTLHFLRVTRDISPVFLDTEVDMSAVVAHRDAARARGVRYSLVTYSVWQAGRVLAAHPEANVAIRGTLRPRTIRYGSVIAKVTLDRSVNGQRVVLSVLLPGADTASMDGLQERLDEIRDSDPERSPEFAPVRLLHRLPVPLGRLAYRIGVRPLRRRADAFGTVSITSLGHRPVDGFYSVGGTTITLGLGQVTNRPVVRADAVTSAPVMRLSLAFDHRVIDGAEAADILTDFKNGLEQLPGLAAQPLEAEREVIR